MGDHLRKASHTNFIFLVIDELLTDQAEEMKGFRGEPVTGKSWAGQALLSPSFLVAVWQCGRKPRHGTIFFQREEQAGGFQAPGMVRVSRLRFLHFVIIPVQWQRKLKQLPPTSPKIQGMFRQPTPGTLQR